MANAQDNSVRYEEAKARAAASRPSVRETFPDADGFANLPPQELYVEDQSSIATSYSGNDPSYDPVSFDESTSVASSSRGRLVEPVDRTPQDQMPISALIQGFSTPTASPPDSGEDQNTINVARQIRYSQMMRLNARRQVRIEIGTEQRFSQTERESYFPQGTDLSFEASQRRVAEYRRLTGTAPDTPMRRRNVLGPHAGSTASRRDVRQALEASSYWSSDDWEAHNRAQNQAWRDNSQGWRDPHQEAWQEDPWNDGAHASNWSNSASHHSSSSGWNARGGWSDNSRNPHPRGHNTTASASQPDVDMSDAASGRTPGTPYDENVGD